MRDGRVIGMALLALAVLAGVLMVGWLLWPTAPAVPTPSAAPVPMRSEVAPAEPAADTAALMQRARDHLARGALIAPPGANAVETYLAVLQREADHAAARAALIEMQPVVADGIRGALASADWPEAERLLALLRQLDPASMLLEPLTAELARRQAEAAAVEQARLAATVLPVAPPESPPASSREALPPATASAAAPNPVPEVSPSSLAAAPAPAEPVPAPTAPRPASPVPPPVRETPARLLNNPPVSYPPQARRQRLEGWVEVEVQIDADGAVADARVLRAEPPGVFDREALRTAQRWRFAPREVDGQPVPSTARRRVAFSLGS